MTDLTPVDRAPATRGTTSINWALISDLNSRPHKHLNIADDLHKVPQAWIGEVFEEARAVQHLCDLAGIPEGLSYSAHIDARVYLLLAETVELRERLARLAGWHSRESGPSGTVGDFCTECGTRWPCDTRRMAEGTYEDEPVPPGENQGATG